MDYSRDVQSHFEHPRNVGSLDKASRYVGTGVAGAPECGDVMKFQIEVGDGGQIVRARFKTFGCGSAIAASSFTTEWLEGRTLQEASALRGRDIAEALSLAADKLHCADLAQQAVTAAIDDYQRKQRA